MSTGKLTWLQFTQGVFLAVALISFVGCGDRPEKQDDASAKKGQEDYKIVATIGMVWDLAKQVAGDRTEVQMLIGPGVDPHLYKTTRSDIEKLMQADVVFYSGLMLEGKMTDALVNAATSGKKVYPVTELLDEQFLLEPEDFEGHYDPHVWMDPEGWAKAVAVIRDKLIAYDPAGKELYTENAQALITEIEALDVYAKQVLASVPQQSRALVTAHDAFNYFGRRYGYEVIGIQGISTESEAGVQDIERMVDLLVDRKIAAVFVESTVSDRNIRALIEGAKAKGHRIVIGGELFSDAMGKEGTYEGTYVGMIDHNVTTIARALGGQAPAKGMQGKLSGEH